jgi:glycosyltransferase involved in cell wall biosynthesis
MPSDKMTPLNILYIHQCYGPLAGAEANVLITATELSKRGHRVAILHGPSSGKASEAWDKVFVARMEATGGDFVNTAIRSFKPDAIFMHKTSDLTLIAGVLDSGVPVVRMVHDHDIYCLRGYKYNYWTRKICTRAASWRCVFPCLGCVVRNSDGGALPIKLVSYVDKHREIALNHRCDRMVVVTTYMRDELLKNGFDAQRIRIHGPVPREGEKGLRSSFSDRNLILYAGQIIRGKGVDVLLEALAKVQSPFECVILGDGNHKAYCEKLSRRLGLADRVTFKGFIPQDELKAYYRECSVVALSSVWPEPIATIGLEVMRYALPVVAFDAGGIKDWLHDGHNGFLVPWMDTDTFANRVDLLLKDKATARTMGENGLQLVSEQYEFEGYISDLENLFSEVIAERRPARIPLSITTQTLLPA